MTAAPKDSWKVSSNKEPPSRIKQRNRAKKMELPNDPMMLFSTVNMYLRDRYQSLDELCADLDIERKELEAKLLQAGFEYSEKYNKFW